MLATKPAEHGKGVGSTLLSHLDAMLANSYQHIFLETAKALNVQYYAKRGYELYDKLQVNTDLEIFFMRKSSTGHSVV